MALTYQDINAYTNDLIIPKSTDVVFKRSPVLTRLLSRNMIRFEGGTQIRRPLMIGRLNGGAAGRGEGFNIDFVPTDTALFTNLKMYWVGITLYGWDDMVNRGPQAVFSQVESKFVNASLTMAEMLAEALYNHGTGDRIKHINGFTEWYDDGNQYASVGGITRTDLMAAGTVGGLNAYYKDLVNAFAISDVQKAYGKAHFGPDAVDLIVVTQDGYDEFWGVSQPLQRYSDAGSSDVAQIGHRAFRFQAADVVVDQYAPADYMWGLNTKYIELYMSANRRFQFGFTGFKEAQDTIDVAGQYLVALNMICPNPRTGFKLKSTKF